MKNLFQFSVKIIGTLALLIATQLNIFAQTSQDSVEVIFLVTKKVETCRYCQGKGYNKSISDIHFKNEHHNTKYSKVLSKIKVGLTQAAFLDYKNINKVCDISRTGNHGIEYSTEQQTIRKKYSLVEIDKLLKDIIASEIVAGKKEKLNQSMLSSLDSFNLGLKDIVATKNIDNLELMHRNMKRLMFLAGERDGQDGISYSTNIVIETAGDAAGFGSVYKDFSYSQLEYRLLYSMLVVGQHDDVIKIVEKREQNGIKSKDLYMLKGMGQLLQGEFSGASNAFTSAFDKNKNTYYLLCPSLSKYINEFKTYQPENKNLKFFGTTKLQLSLALFDCTCLFETN